MRAASGTLGQAPSRGGEFSQLLCRVRVCEKASSWVAVHENENRVEVGVSNGHSDSLRFDRIFRNDNQEELFSHLQPALLACVGGAACTVVAHGGPQSGKSYALSGLFTSGETHGIAPRTIHCITEEMERMAGPAPTVEASFFEVQQDSLCDLLAGGKVTIREMSQPPWVALDQNLSAMRCDGATGFNRLLDAYFTGLEHRRKGGHSCFQIAFTRANRKRSHLRIIEMAWPRAKEGTKPTGGKASAALEQVLQSKLSGAPAVYRGSPLALLLKPCLEGASSLCFIHCMRLDQPHLGCLATAAPLLAKLYLWLGQERKARARGGSPLARRVPPLQLSGSTGGSCTLTNTDSQLSAVDTQPSCTPTSSSRSSCSQKQPVAIAASISEESSVLTGGGEGGTGEASAVKTPAENPEQDDQITELILDLMQVKRRTVEALEQDAKHSSSTFQALDALLGYIMSQREAQINTGPDERETNLKLVYEQVYRSIQRSTEEASKIRHEIQELDSFCQKGYIPPIYDAYNCSQQDIEKMKELQTSTPAKDSQPSNSPVPQVIQIPQLQLSGIQGSPELPTQEAEVSESSSGSSSCTPVASGPPPSEPAWAGKVSAQPAPSQGPATLASMPPTPPVPVPQAAQAPAPHAVSQTHVHVPMWGGGSPTLPYRPVSNPAPREATPFREVRVGSVKVPSRATLSGVASESHLSLGPMQASPPRFRVPNPRPNIRGGSLGGSVGGSMTVGPAGCMITQVSSPLQGFRTTTPSKTSASPVIMTRAVSGAPHAPVPVSRAPPEVRQGYGIAPVLRGCRSASELPRGPMGGAMGWGPRP